MAVHKIQCSEIWGGNQGDELAVETSGVRACLFSRACDGGKGGDIYYFSVCESDLLTRIAIVDVMGHGEAVSDTSTWLYDSLAARMNSADSNAVLTDLNKASVEKGYKAMSTAAVAGFYRGDSTFHFSYAGHHEILHLISGESEWRTLSPTKSDRLEDLPLGIDEECAFTMKSISVGAGDQLFIYTDGVIEASDEDGELFGDERLVSRLNEFAGRELTEIREGVLDAVLKHTGGNLAHDDVTFMVVEIASET